MLLSRAAGDYSRYCKQSTSSSLLNFSSTKAHNYSNVCPERQIGQFGVFQTVGKLTVEFDTVKLPPMLTQQVSIATCAQLDTLNNKSSDIHIGQKSNISKGNFTPSQSTTPEIKHPTDDPRSPRENHNTPTRDFDGTGPKNYTEMH